MTAAERILAALPANGGPVIHGDLPRLTGLDERAVALAVAALWAEGKVRAWAWCGGHFVAREGHPPPVREPRDEPAAAE